MLFAAGFAPEAFAASSSPTVGRCAGARGFDGFGVAAAARFAFFFPIAIARPPRLRTGAGRGAMRRQRITPFRRGGARRRRCARASAYAVPGRAPQAKRLRSVPMPSISIATSLPGRIGPTPTDVPHRITSPGNSVMSAEIRLTSRWTEKRMSLIG